MDDFNLISWRRRALLEEENSRNSYIVLYTSYYPEGFEGTESDPLSKDTAWHPEFKRGMSASPGEGSTGTSEDNPVILCSKLPFELVDFEGEELSRVEVKFKKNLNEVYIDRDDYDLDEFGITDQKGADSLIASNPKTTLQDLLPFGLNVKDPDLSFYGCYVLNINPAEIVKISQKEPDMLEEGWKDLAAGAALTAATLGGMHGQAHAAPKIGDKFKDKIEKVGGGIQKLKDKVADFKKHQDTPQEGETFKHAFARMEKMDGFGWGNSKDYNIARKKALYSALVELNHDSGKQASLRASLDPKSVETVEEKVFQEDGEYVVLMVLKMSTQK